MVMQKKVITSILSLLAISLLIGDSLVSAASNDNTNFNVNVKETLSVSITTPTNWATGDIDEFLRNKVSINVVSNNASGFTASMTTKTNDTFLTNTTKNAYTLPTLTANTTRANFPANFWGYSVNDTDAGNTSSTYAALPAASATPVTLLSSNKAATGSKDFYFGARANAAQAAGTYTGTVVINVVSGAINNNTNPIKPVDPAVPNTNDNTAAYSSSGGANGTTTYTYRRTNATNGTNTTTTEVSDGDNRDAYIGYTPPQGETYKSAARISTSSALAIGLATTSSIAAASGIFFFILAKRDDDDNEEDDQVEQM